MSFFIEIKSCGECPHADKFMDFCGMMEDEWPENEDGSTDDQPISYSGIPAWCPLDNEAKDNPKTTQELIEPEKHVSIPVRWNK